MKEAEKILKENGLSLRTAGEGETITGQIPAAGESVPGGSQVLVYLGEDVQQELVTVPDFHGMNRQQASDAAVQLGLYILVTGNPEMSQCVTVTSQDIAPGTQVQSGTTIRLEFADTQAAD